MQRLLLSILPLLPLLLADAAGAQPVYRQNYVSGIQAPYICYQGRLTRWVDQPGGEVAQVIFSGNSFGNVSYECYPGQTTGLYQVRFYFYPEPARTYTLEIQRCTAQGSGCLPYQKKLDDWYFVPDLPSDTNMDGIVGIPDLNELSATYGDGTGFEGPDPERLCTTDRCLWIDDLPQPGP